MRRGVIEEAPWESFVKHVATCVMGLLPLGRNGNVVNRRARELVGELSAGRGDGSCEARAPPKEGAGLVQAVMKVQGEVLIF